MSPFLIEIIGYIALGINLISMATKGEFKLRLISLIANCFFIFYGFLLAAKPIIFGCAIAIILHGYHLRRLLINKSKNND